MKNRCKNTGLERKKPFLSTDRSKIVRAEVDRFIDKQIEKWNAEVPNAQHFEGKKVDPLYYKRHLIETALRIRLLRVSEAKTLSEIAKTSPEAAQIWAHYEMEEMIHDTLFLQDLNAAGVSEKVAYETEPFLSTKLLTGFFSYLLDHEGPLGVVAYSYLVEYVNVKIDPAKIKGMKESLGEDLIQGQMSHTNTDEVDDHPGEVWNCLRYLMTSEDEIKSLYTYFEEHQRILAMYFEEIDQFARKARAEEKAA